MSGISLSALSAMRTSSYSTDAQAEYDIALHRAAPALIAAALALTTLYRLVHDKTSSYDDCTAAWDAARAAAEAFRT